MRDSFWRTFLYLLVAGLLVAVVQQVLAQVTRPLAAAVTIGGRNDTYTQAAAAMIALALSMGLGMLGQLLTTPFMAIYTYLMYLDQTRRDRGEVKAAWPPGEPWQSPEYPRYRASNQYPQQGDRPYYEQQYPPQYPGNQPYQGN